MNRTSVMLLAAGFLAILDACNDHTASVTPSPTPEAGLQQQIDSIMRKIALESGVYILVGVDARAETANDQLTLDRLNKELADQSATPTPTPDYTPTPKPTPLASRKIVHVQNAVPSQIDRQVVVIESKVKWSLDWNSEKGAAEDFANVIKVMKALKITPNSTLLDDINYDARVTYLPSDVKSIAVRLPMRKLITFFFHPSRKRPEIRPLAPI